MTRQESYIAELSQLLFYMTAWDKAEVLKGITAMINHPETGLQTMEELGNPMKLAVTLHRQYTPTPEPTPEELARKAALEEVSEETAELLAIVEEELEHAEEDVARAYFEVGLRDEYIGAEVPVREHDSLAHSCSA